MRRGPRALQREREFKNEKRVRALRAAPRGVARTALRATAQPPQCAPPAANLPPHPPIRPPTHPHIHAPMPFQADEVVTYTTSALGASSTELAQAFVDDLAGEGGARAARALARMALRC